MIRLLLVHPNQMTCELFSAVLRNESDLKVVGCAHCGDEALELLRKHRCDVVLMDFNLPDQSALAYTRLINQHTERTKVIITGLAKSNNMVLRCVEEGVAGYVYQEETLADLVKKIRSVFDDEFLVAPEVAYMLMTRIAELNQMTKELNGISAEHVTEFFTELTPREWEVLGLIEQGMSNQAIAETLIIEKGTVKNHVHNILSKLDVPCRKQAAVLARQMTLAKTPALPEKIAVKSSFSISQPADRSSKGSVRRKPVAA